VEWKLGVESKRPSSFSWLYVTAWYATSAGFLMLLPLWKFGVPWWQLPLSQSLPGACLAAAFVVSAGIAVLMKPDGRRLLVVAVSELAIFGLVFLGLFVAKSDFSRAIALAMFATAIVVPTPFVSNASWWQRALAFGALIATVSVALSAINAAGQAISQVPKSGLIRTAYYNLDMVIYSGPKSLVHGGALARIGDSYMLLTGDGHLFAFGLDEQNDRPDFKELPYRVPINGVEFSAAAGRPWMTPLEDAIGEGQRAASGTEILNSEWFRTYGLLVQEVGRDARIFVSYAYWRAAEECWVERVSMLQADRVAFFRGTAGLEWKTLYETTPCLPVRGEHRRRGIPFVGYFGGGRMALLDSQTLLLTVGDFGFDGVASDAALPQDSAASYGKTLAINIADGHATLFTLGHRNPQGLYIDQSGTLWSTEHGPRGGDELNRLIRGANYGWPYATFGTDYGSLSWPLNKPELEQLGYEAPVFAWLPSIGVSNLLRVEQGLFSRWRGDLLVASLRAETLFRTHIRDGRVVYLEPITIGSRIRDLIEGPDGRIVLWTDEGTLVSLRPKQGATGEGLFAEKCGGCHQSEAISGNRIGPNLLRIVGRRIASLEYPDYSRCLRGLGGVWTKVRLDAFLKAPGALCPGTAMDFSGVTNEVERAAIVGYLSTL
jgi:cytochrome c2